MRDHQNLFEQASKKHRTSELRRSEERLQVQAATEEVVGRLGCRKEKLRFWFRHEAAASPSPLKEEGKRAHSCHATKKNKNKQSLCVVVTYSGYRTGRLERERSVVCLNVVCVCFQVSEGFLFFQKKGVIQVRERLRDQVVALHVHGAQRKQARKASKRKKLHWLAAMANAGKFFFFYSS